MPLIQEAWQEFWPSTPGPGPLPWLPIGPGNIGGRIRSILIHPSNPNLIWVAGVSGGVWRSTDGGGSWATNTDFVGNINVSHMVADPRSPLTLYAATGGETLQGNGIFKSINGGTKWGGLAFTQHNTNFAGINRLAISGDGVLLAGTYSGLFRSSDSGINWTQTTLSGFEVYDIHFHPNDPNQAIASGRWGNIYYSNDAGITWQPSEFLIRPPGSGTIKVAYAKSDPTVVYANTLTENLAGQLYVSIDGGKSFVPMGQCCTGVLWWANCLWVDPTNPNTVIYGGGSIFRSFDRGYTRVYANGHHEDSQIIVEDPGYDGVNNRTAWLGSDGGLDRTLDILNVPSPAPPYGQSWVTWQNMNHGLGITQFLGAAGNPTTGVIVGGTQDNGNIRYNPPNSNSWNGLYGADGGYCAADQTDPKYFYMESYYLSLMRSSNGGKSVELIYGNLPRNCGGYPCANFTAPFILDPNHQDWLLGGGYPLWKSTNIKIPEAQYIQWNEIKPQTASQSFISAIAVQKGNSDNIWVGHLNGEVYFTSNGTEKHPAWTQVNGLPHRYCSHIDIGPAGDVFVTFGGFTRGNIWRYSHSQWQDVSGSLPDIPIYTVLASSRPNHVYIGTEIGVFASGNNGQTWSPGNRGPADVAVFTLFWMGPDQLVAATFGRGMFTIGPATH